ncbi:MAG: tape measure protein [Butyricicoccus pullicaecorum]|nr:tape measure protein [Butyricicoccus pullicaecorum]
MPNIREELTLVDNFSSQFTRFIQLAEQSAASVMDLRGSLNNIETTTARAALATEQLAQRMSGASRQADNAGNAISGLMGRVQGLIASYVGLQTISGLGNLSDTFTQTTARINLMNDGLQTTQELTQMIYQSAQNSRGAFNATASMVSKLGTLAGNAFNSSQEIVAFAEQLNKQMAISGTSVQEGQAAMLQLTQAMASGVLRGEELNSLLEQTPMIAQTIAQYLGVSTGEMKNMASEGLVTAEIVKNAMFWAADETNRKFEQMPMTWAQVWQSFKNTATMALQPVLNGINWLANNIDIVAPLVLGLAGAFAVFLIAANWINICTAATRILASAQAMAAAVTATAWGWPVIVIVALIGVLFAAVAAVNHFAGTSISAFGLITGAISVAVAFIWNVFATFFNYIMDGLVLIVNAFIGVGNIIATCFNNPARAAVEVIRGMADTILGILESIASAIDTLFGTGLASAVSGLRGRLGDWANSFGEATVWREPINASDLHLERMEYGDAWNKGYDWGSNFSIGDVLGLGNIPEISIPTYTPASSLLGDIGDIGKNTGKTAGNTSALKDAVDMTNEDLKMLVDMAERQYVAQVNLTAQSPVINITGQNTGNTADDRAAMADAIKRVLLEQRASGTYRAYARV